MKSFTVEKICRLPVDFATANKSSYTLAKESNFQETYKEITTKDISDYLITHKDLIDRWEMWSQDKRTTGYWLLVTNDYEIGNINPKGETIFNKTFSSAIDACSEYVLREVGSILDIDVEAQIK